MFSAAVKHPGCEALDQIDRVLKGHPSKDDHALSEATRCLAQFREEMLAERRAGGAIDAGRLAHLNAIIAVVMAMHFPIGQPPWAELEKARGWLEAVVKAEEG